MPLVNIDNNELGLSLDQFKSAAGFKGESKVTPVPEVKVAKNLFDSPPDATLPKTPTESKPVTLLWGSEGKYKLGLDWQEAILPQQSNDPDLGYDPPEGFSVKFVTALEKSVAKDEKEREEWTAKARKEWDERVDSSDPNNLKLTDDPRNLKMQEISHWKNVLVDSKDQQMKTVAVKELVKIDPKEAEQIVETFATQEGIITGVESLPAIVAAGYAIGGAEIAPYVRVKFSNVSPATWDIVERAVSSGTIFASISGTRAFADANADPEKDAGEVAWETVKGAGKGFLFGGTLGAVHNPLAVVGIFTAANMLPQKDGEGNELPGMPLTKAATIATMEYAMYSAMGLSPSKYIKEIKAKFSSYKDAKPLFDNAASGVKVTEGSGTTYNIAFDKDGKPVGYKKRTPKTDGSFTETIVTKQQYETGVKAAAKQGTTQDAEYTMRPKTATDVATTVGKVFGDGAVTELNTPPVAPTPVGLPVATRLGIRPAPVRKVIGDANNAIYAKQRAYLETASNASLNTWVGELAKGGVIFDIEEELKDTPDVRSKLIDLILNNDPDFRERRVDAKRSAVAKDTTLTPWEKLATVWGEETGAAAEDIEHLRTVQEAIYKQQVIDGKVVDTFDNWLNKRISLEMEKTNIPMFQLEEAAAKVPAGSADNIAKERGLIKIYHGSRKTGVSATDLIPSEGALGTGIYWTTNPKSADARKGGDLVEAYIDPMKLIEYESGKTTDDGSNIIRKINDGESHIVLSDLSIIVTKENLVSTSAPTQEAPISTATAKEAAAGNVPIHPTQLPDEVRHSLYELAYHEGASDPVEAAANYNSVLSQLVPGRSQVEIVEGIKRITTLTDWQRAEAIKIVNTLIAYDKDGKYEKPEGYSERAGKLASVTQDSKLPASFKQEGKQGLLQDLRQQYSEIEEQLRNDEKAAFRNKTFNHDYPVLQETQRTKLKIQLKDLNKSITKLTLQTEESPGIFSSSKYQHLLYTPGKGDNYVTFSDKGGPISWDEYLPDIKIIPKNKGDISFIEITTPQGNVFTLPEKESEEFFNFGIEENKNIIRYGQAGLIEYLASTQNLKTYPEIRQAIEAQYPEGINRVAAYAEKEYTLALLDVIEKSGVTFDSKIYSGKLQKSFEQTGAIYKSGAAVVNALIRFGKDKSAYIQVFKTGNFSSIAHELSHTFLLDFTPAQVETLAKIVAKHTSAGVKDMQAMQRALNLFISNPQHPSLISYGEYKPALVTPMEFLARSFEQYLHVGKAPIFELQQPFKEMSKLMKQTYKSLKSIPNLTNKLDPTMSALFNELLGGPQFTEAVSVPFTIDGKTYMTFVSKVRKNAKDDIDKKLAKRKAKIILRKVEQGQAEVAGMVEEVREYAVAMLGENVPAYDAKGKLVSRPNPLLKDTGLLLKLEQMRTVDDAYKAVAYINNLAVQRENGIKQNVIGKIQKLRRDIDWKRIDPLYKEKLLDLFEGVDFKKMSDKKLAALSSLRDTIEKDIAANNVRPELLQVPLEKLKELDRLSKKNLYEMTVDELNLLHDSVKMLAQLHALKGELIFKRTFDFLKAARDKAAKQLSIWETDPNRDLTGMGDTLPERRFFRRLADTIKYNTKSLEQLFEVIGGIELDSNLMPIHPTQPSTQLGKVWHAIQEGSSKAREVEQMTTDFAQELAGIVDMSTWSRELDTLGHHGNHPAWTGKDAEYEMAAATMLVFNPETNTSSPITTHVLIAKGEALPVSSTPTNYKVTYADKGKSITKDIDKTLYESLMKPEIRLSSLDYVYAEFYIEDGKGVTKVMYPITKAQRITLYAYSLNNFATESLLTGGIRLRTNKDVQYKITAEALRKLTLEISADEKFIAERMMRFMEDYIKPQANAVSRNTVFFDIMIEPNYFPLNKYAPDRGQEEVVNKPMLNEQLAGFARKYIERSGFLQTRSGVNAPVYLDSAFEIFSNYGRETGRYIGLTLPLRLVKAVISNESDPTSFISRLRRTKEWGPKTADTIKELVRRLEDTSVHTTALDNVLRQAQSAVIESVLLANISVFGIQGTTIPLVRNYGVSAKNLAKAMARHLLPRHSIERLAQIHSDIRYRYDSGVTYDILDTHRITNVKNDWIPREKLWDKFSNIRTLEDLKLAIHEGLKGDVVRWLYYGDAMAASAMFDAIQLQVKEDMSHLTPAEQEHEAVERLRMLIRRTQSTNLRESMNLVGSSPSAAVKIIFGALQNQNHQLDQERWYARHILRTQLRRMKEQEEEAKKKDEGKSREERRKNERERKKEDAKRKRKFIWDLLMLLARIDITMSLKIAVWRQMLYELGEDPDKKNDIGFIERTVFGTLNNFLSTRPIWGPYAASIMDTMSKGKYNSFEINNLVTTSITQITQSYGESLHQLKEGEFLKAGAAVLEGSAYTAGLMFGYPLMQIKRDIRYIVNPIRKLLNTSNTGNL